MLPPALTLISFAVQGVHEAQSSQCMHWTRHSSAKRQGWKASAKEDVESGLLDEIIKRFARADGAPICQGALYNLLGYSADAELVEAILEGTFIPSPGIDGPKLIIPEEITRNWKKMGDGEPNIIITQEDYQHYWKQVKERIASSYSGLHFGHYK